MTGQTLLQPSLQTEAMIGGVNKWRSVFGVTSNLFPLLGLSLSGASTVAVHAASTQFGVETRK